MKIKILLALILSLPEWAFSQISNNGIRKMEIGGYIGERIQTCIENRVKAQNVEELIEPFLNLTEGKGWQSEFLGKWMLGAISSYEYTRDKELYQTINKAARRLMNAQYADGYIGNYKPEDRLTNWDIWGRKYTALSLLAYYRLTKDEKALVVVRRLIDHLIKELHDKKVDIAETGCYYGMASCSILEPVVYLYRETKNPDYLDFAKSIARSIERKGHSQLITKALQDVPVYSYSPLPQSWWSFENGQKAYEMMSCYEGIMELGQILGDSLYLKSVGKVADNILRNEINIAGSGAAFECWYEGRKLQTVPTYHTMETCVTFTWMQLCARLLQHTANALYADAFECTMYNALMAAMKKDGSQISKYSPLEGRRQKGEEQCNMHINCCNANGPRAFALIPPMAYLVKHDKIYVNLYLDSKTTVALGKNEIGLEMQTCYPIDGKVELLVQPQKEKEFAIAFRIPSWLDDDYQVLVNGKPQKGTYEKGYFFVQRNWKKGDKISVDFSLKTKVMEYNHQQAIVHGPLVFARDSRFSDGDVDECAVIQCNEKGIVEAVFETPRKDSFAWVTIKVPMVLGTDLEDSNNKAVKLIRFCDFASSGNDWDISGRYRVWIPKTLNVMSEPYHHY